MELVLLWLVFAVFAMIDRDDTEESLGRRMVLRRVGAWPFGLLVFLMPMATIPDIEGCAAREEYERKRRDRMDMSKLSSSRSDSE